MLIGEKIKLACGFEPLSLAYTETEKSLSESCRIAFPDLLSCSSQSSHGPVWPKQRGRGGAKE